MLVPDIYTRVANATKIDNDLVSELLEEAMKYSRKKHSRYRCEDDIEDAAQEAVCNILRFRPADVKEAMKDWIRKHFRSENSHNATMRRESKSHAGSGKRVLDTQGRFRKVASIDRQQHAALDYDELLAKCETDTERELVVLIVSDGVSIHDAMEQLGLDRAEVRIIGRRLLDKEDIDWQAREQYKARRNK